MKKIYGYCKNCGNYCYRYDNGIFPEEWLLDFVSEMTAEQIQEAEANIINCGCN